MIAYDLRYACDHFVGIATYAYDVLDALLQVPGDQHYAVLWDPRQPHTRFDFSRLRSHPVVTWTERPYAPLSPLSLAQVGVWLRSLAPAVYFSPFHLLPFRPDCPCVVTVHDVRSLRFATELSPWRRVPYRWSLVRATRARLLVTDSDFSRREVTELLPVDSARVRTVYPGVHSGLGRAAPRRPTGLPEGGFALVVGDNRPHKNLVVLAEAWARLGVDAPLQLVSAGPAHPRHPDLAALARAAGACAVCLGRVPEAELVWLYRNATLVLFPSVYEGFGLPLVEAFAHGVPAVVSDIQVFREIGAGAACFVAPDSAETWAGEVRRLAGDREARARLGAAGRARAAEMTCDRTAKGVLALLREAAAGGATA